MAKPTLEEVQALGFASHEECEKHQRFLRQNKFMAENCEPIVQQARITHVIYLSDVARLTQAALAVL